MRTKISVKEVSALTTLVALVRVKADEVADLDREYADALRADAQTAIDMLISFAWDTDSFTMEEEENERIQARKEEEEHYADYSDQEEA